MRDAAEYARVEVRITLGGITSVLRAERAVSPTLSIDGMVRMVGGNILTLPGEAQDLTTREVRVTFVAATDEATGKQVTLTSDLARHITTTLVGEPEVWAERYHQCVVECFRARAWDDYEVWDWQEMPEQNRALLIAAARRLLDGPEAEETSND